MDKVIEIKNSNIDDVINTDKLVLLDFWAEWCGPCKALNPVIKEIAEQYQNNLIVAKANVDDNRDLSIKNNIRSIPTILFFKEGNLVETKIGATANSDIKSEIESIINKHI